MSNAIQYHLPDCWISYDQRAVHKSLLSAKAPIKALRMIPFRRRWADETHSNQLKLEISGTSQIEGAEFLGDEFDKALQAGTHAELETRSQRQAKSALKAYQWVAGVPDDQPISPDLIKTIHRLVVTGCDDDHCEPGELRGADQNVTFGSPRHRGALGGRVCKLALQGLAKEAATTFRSHDPLIQASAAHYHFAAMHPFLDGNGRTARALEALMLQRAGLRDVLFVPMSSFYLRAKDDYLENLAESRRHNHDLTPFLRFTLRGVEAEASRLTAMLAREASKEIFRNLVNDLLAELANTRMRVIVRRQLTLVAHLLDEDQEMEIQALAAEVREHYKTRKDPLAALTRDVIRLEALGAARLRFDSGELGRGVLVSINLDWPKTMTVARFFQLVKELPKRNPNSLLTP